MTLLRLARGKKGEEEAAKELKRRGLHIVQRNFRCSLGEIDIIAEKGGTLVFVEVKAKTSTAFGLPQESVTFSKQVKIRKIAQFFLSQTKQFHREISFWVVAVTLSKDNSLIHLEVIEDAF